MKYFLGLLALLLLATAASAKSGTTIDSGPPPTKYQHDTVSPEVWFVSPKDINGEFCGKAPAGYVTLACTFMDTGKMVLPNPCSPAFAGEKFAGTVCHELGHLNGWPPTHPR